MDPWLVTSVVKMNLRERMAKCGVMAGLPGWNGNLARSDMPHVRAQGSGVETTREVEILRLENSINRSVDTSVKGWADRLTDRLCGIYRRVLTMLSRWAPEM